MLKCFNKKTIDIEKVFFPDYLICYKNFIQSILALGSALLVGWFSTLVNTELF